MGCGWFVERTPNAEPAFAQNMCIKQRRRNIFVFGQLLPALKTLKRLPRREWKRRFQDNEVRQMQFGNEENPSQPSVSAIRTDSPWRVIRVIRGSIFTASASVISTRSRSLKLS